jgi:hypothetical protein
MEIEIREIIDRFIVSLRNNNGKFIVHEPKYFEQKSS